MSNATMSSYLRALRYEAYRLRTAPSARVLAGLALLGAGLATLPAAQALGGHPGGLGQAGLADVAWVVDGGRLGAVLPGALAAVAAAWLGASSLDYEYRHGMAVSLFASIPRRGTVVLAKISLVVVFAAVLELAGAGLAFGATSLGFGMAGFPRPLPAAAAFATPAELVSAVLCAVLSLLLATIVRVRLFAVALAVALVAGAAACVAGTRYSGTAPGMVGTGGETDPLAGPVTDALARTSAFAHLAGPWNSAPFLGLGLLGVLALVCAVLAQSTVGRRRAQ
ncbi:MAG TPA: hypothetical protein VGX23_24975 [Actinocrinis sp.]|nr:hypothetical protein [Actinocrinis sp.]